MRSRSSSRRSATTGRTTFRRNRPKTASRRARSKNSRSRGDTRRGFVYFHLGQDANIANWVVILAISRSSITRFGVTSPENCSRKVAKVADPDHKYFHNLLTLGDRPVRIINAYQSRRLRIGG